MDLAGSPFTWLTFDERGLLTDAGAFDALKQLLTAEVTDLVLISHGWKNDRADAQALYTDLWSNVRPLLAAQQARPVTGFVLAGVQWPALVYRTNFDSPATNDGSALSLPPTAATDGDLSTEAFDAVVQDAADLAGQAGQALRTAVQAADAKIGPEQAQALLDALSTAFPARLTNADIELRQSRVPLTSHDPMETLLDLIAPPPVSANIDVGAAQGLDDIIGHAISGPRAAIARLMNQFTYYEMKARAGDVGAALGARVLSTLMPGPGRLIRLHLIGHSFGARLVTSAAASLTPRENIELRSLTLLQGAFSQNALSADFGGGQAGAFVGVVDKVGGAITATHTHNDSACTIAYALASRLVRDNALAIGDASDQYGAIGANGILHLLPARVIDGAMAVNGTYSLTPGKVHNFLADACISEHNDVRNAQVGRLVCAALLS